MLKKKITGSHTSRKKAAGKIAKKGCKAARSTTRNFSVTYVMCPRHGVRYPRGGSCPEC